GGPGRWAEPQARPFAVLERPGENIDLLAATRKPGQAASGAHIPAVRGLIGVEQEEPLDRLLDALDPNGRERLGVHETARQFVGFAAQAYGAGLGGLLEARRDVNGRAEHVLRLQPAGPAAPEDDLAEMDPDPHLDG